MSTDRRLRRLAIPHFTVVSWLNMGLRAVGAWMPPDLPGLPDGYEVTRMYQVSDDEFFVVVRHESFPPVPFGEAIPPFEPIAPARAWAQVNAALGDRLKRVAAAIEGDVSGVSWCPTSPRTASYRVGDGQLRPMTPAPPSGTMDDDPQPLIVGPRARQ